MEQKQHQSLVGRLGAGHQTRRLRKLIASRAREGQVLLHLGCGSRLFPGWINIDIHSPGANPDIILNLEFGLPAPEASVDLIYSEDFIEHISREGGRRLLAECHRALKPGGVMRILTPNLNLFVQQYIDRNESHLAWYREQFGCRTFGEMLNSGMREWGHKCLYDEETLAGILTEIGFTLRKQSFGKSDEAILQNRDSRNSGEGSLSMYYDCYKGGKG